MRPAVDRLCALRVKTTQIVAVHRQHIEGAELHLFIVPAGVQCVEVAVAIDTQDDSLAIDHKMLDAVLQRGVAVAVAVAMYFE